MFSTLFTAFEILGTVAFAISGAMVAIEKRVDLFGVLFLGFVTAMGGPVYYGGLAEGFVDVSSLSDNCAQGTAEAIEAVRELIVSGDWDVFSGVKLELKDGVVTKVDAPLMDNAGNEIVAAGGASVEDSVITGSMNYYVAGVQEA